MRIKKQYPKPLKYTREVLNVGARYVLDHANDMKQHRVDDLLAILQQKSPVPILSHKLYAKTFAAEQKKGSIAEYKMLHAGASLAMMLDGYSGIVFPWTLGGGVYNVQETKRTEGLDPLNAYRLLEELGVKVPAGLEGWRDLPYNKERFCFVTVKLSDFLHVVADDDEDKVVWGYALPMGRKYYFYDKAQVDKMANYSNELNYLVPRYPDDEKTSLIAWRDGCSKFKHYIMFCSRLRIPSEVSDLISTDSGESPPVLEFRSDDETLYEIPSTPALSDIKVPITIKAYAQDDWEVLNVYPVTKDGTHLASYMKRVPMNGLSKKLLEGLNSSSPKEDTPASVLWHNLCNLFNDDNKPQDKN